MAMNQGDATATSGLAKTLYDAEQAHKARLEVLAPFNPNTETPASYQNRIVNAVDDSLRKRCFAIADGIVQHLIDNLEVLGVKTSLDAGLRTIEAYVSGGGSNRIVPTPADLAATPYPVNGSVVDSKLDTATQNNSGNVI